MAKTTSEFLEGLKRRITMPANQVLMDDSDILDMGSDCLKLKMTKLLKASRQNYLLTTSDVALVAGQTFYDVPDRAVINGLEEIKLVLSDEQTLKGLAYITVEDLYQFPNQQTYPEAFYFQSDQVGLVPTPASAGCSLRYWWHRQMSRLCAVGDAGQIATIDTGTSTVTVSNVPSTFVANAEIDFIRNQALGTIIEQDQAITNVAGSSLTFDSLPDRLAVGDWVSIAKTTPILPIPEEIYDYYEALVGQDILEAVGDQDGARSMQSDIDDLERDVKSLLEPRIDGEPEKIVNYYSLLRQKTWRPFGGRYW